MPRRKHADLAHLSPEEYRIEANKRTAVERKGYFQVKYIAKKDKEEINPSNMINITKYDMVKTMIDVIFNMGFSMNDTSDMDDTERLIKGVDDDGFNSMPIPFKIAFNTLTINKIIKTYESTNRKNKRSDSEIKK